MRLVSFFGRLLWKIVRPFLFSLDAERAHVLTVSILRALSPFPILLRGVSGASKPVAVLPGGESEKTPESHSEPFPSLSPLGLAAGFDKNAEIIRALPHLGFGFAELGTVTLRPQDGNPKPRLFRFPAENRVFNRMGFNSEGAEKVSARLARERDHLPFRFGVGINLGKNKETPNSQAADEYAELVRFFNGLVDYVVINVSSPNTPGLRDLQAAEELEPIFEGVHDEVSSWSKPKPVFLKIAPEIDGESLSQLIRTGDSWGVNGWVLTNTLKGEYKAQSGGWSGAELTQTALNRLKVARACTDRTLISVGGILRPEDASERLKSGANYVQVYSGFVFGGPTFPTDVLKNMNPR